MMEKFEKSGANDAWSKFKKTGKISDCMMWLSEMQKLDNANKKENEEIEIQ